MSSKDAGNIAHEPTVPRQAATSTSTRRSTVISTLTRSYTSPVLMQTSTATATTPMAAIQTLAYAAPAPDYYCTAALPAGGIIVLNDTFSIRLDETLSFQAPCGNYSIFGANNTLSGNSTVISGDPFYASVAPQFYALAVATVLSYILVTILFITPRTFYLGGPGATSVYNGGGASGLLSRGMTFIGSGASNSSVIGVGRRPLLQKIAALLVMISLTIATANTFSVANSQYDGGYMDAPTLVQRVVGSMEVRVTRVISATFLWLAQVQTLIRLFPRHKEKVTIKWLGFGLVLCDTVFSILENFVSRADITRPQSFTDPIPALSYLFELSISLIYASCVIYYCLSKRRFAFWNSKMKSMCVMALLSLSAVLIPVVFFIVDVVQPDVATWGEYIRWVGATAASVVVWEWVERIEALERDDRKDGILGREIFDGDEMLDSTHDDTHGHRGPSRAGRRPSGGPEKEKRSLWKDVRELNFSSRAPPVEWNKHANRVRGKAKIGKTHYRKASAVDGIARPPQVATPISRADTTSASTVYAVRHHDPLSPSPIILEEPADLDSPNVPSDESTLTNNTNETRSSKDSHSESSDRAVPSGRQVWHAVAHPFKRKRAEPPAEVAAQVADANMRRSPAIGSSSFRSRFNVLGLTSKSRDGHGSPKSRTPQQVTFIPARPRARRSERATGDTHGTSHFQSETLNIPHEPIRPSHDTVRTENLPVMIIPAPSRGGRTWSPDDLCHNSPEPDSSRQDRTLRFQDTPRDSPEHSEPSVRFGSPARDRSYAVTSISDRLSTSPPALHPSSGPTSSTAPPAPRALSGNNSSQPDQPNEATARPTAQLQAHNHTISRSRSGTGPGSSGVQRVRSHSAGPRSHDNG